MRVQFSQQHGSCRLQGFRQGHVPMVHVPAIKCAGAAVAHLRSWPETRMMLRACRW